ncbi:MAG TPA: hypothetical protein VFD70_07250 [Anaerolineae bacterium]|nr:hypothetical protein [Anaerolineae bacterium]
MSRNTKSVTKAASRMGVITVLGAGIGTAVGAAMGNVSAGVAVGAGLGLVAGAAWELVQRRKRTH